MNEKRRKPLRQTVGWRWTCEERYLRIIRALHEGAEAEHLRWPERQLVLSKFYSELFRRSTTHADRSIEAKHRTNVSGLLRSAFLHELLQPYAVPLREGWCRLVLVRSVQSWDVNFGEVVEIPAIFAADRKRLVVASESELRLHADFLVEQHLFRASVAHWNENRRSS